MISGGRTTTVPLGNERSITVAERSITELDVEAIVSSDDSALSHGGGVSWAIWDAAGRELEDWADAHVRTLHLGDVIASPGFALRARWVLHAITIDFDANRRATAGDVAALVFSIVAKAEELGVRSLALPRLASGVAGLSGAAVSYAIAGALVEALPETSTLREVVIATPDAYVQTLEAARAAATAGTELVSLARTAASALGERGVGLTSAASSLEHARRASARAAALASMFDHAVDAVGAAVDARLARAVKNAGTARTLLLQAELDPVSRATHARSVRATTIDLLRRVVPPSTPSTDAMGADRIAPLGIASIASPVSVGFPLVAAGFAVLDRVKARAKAGDESTADSTAHPNASSDEPQRLEVGLPTVTAGTEHVRALHRILLDHLEADAIDALLATLDRYRGPRELRLLEYCTVVDDPAALLVEQFGAPGLRKLYGKVVGGPEHVRTASAREIAALMLRHIGFPRVATPRGLTTELADLRRARSSVHASSPTEITGLVVRAGGKLEYLLRVLLRFACRTAFGRPPEVYFRARGTLAESRSYERLGLGSLVSLVEQVDRDLQTSKDPLAESYRRTIGATSLVPRGSGGELARARNAFAHFDRDATPDRKHDLHTEAEEFLDGAIRFLDELSAPDRRVFPYVIAVQKIEIDRLGRRTVHVIDDADHAHRIFTSAELLPGRVYYMHPLTNPLRVDPLLVGAGDGDG